MNIKLWFAENKTMASLLGGFVVITLLLGYLTWSAWDDYATVGADYATKSSKLAELAKHKPFPDQTNLRKLTETLGQQQLDLGKLKKELDRYRIAPAIDLENTKPQDQPQQFQDALRKEVTAVQSEASTSGSTLPSPFYLGFEEYENRVPDPEETPALAKQLTLLAWIAKDLVDQKGVVVTEFSRVSADSASKKEVTNGKKASQPQPGIKKPEAPTAYQSVGTAKVSFHCSQPAFRGLIKDLMSGRYFVVIENVQIQNSSQEPPRKGAQAGTPETPPEAGAGSSQRLSIVVGQETVNVSMTLRGIDFPNTPAPNETGRGAATK
jgi:hypothetical protein